MHDIARRFAEEVIAPSAAAWERERRFPREMFREAGARGLCGLLVPKELGGAGLDTAGFCAVVEELGAADIASAFALVPHNNFAAAIAASGGPLRDRHLAAMMAGGRLGAFLLTEPAAGTHAAAIATVARRTGDGWVLDGEKAWVTGGTEADLLHVYAQTEPGSGGRGIASFVVEADTPGISRTAPYEMLGAHASGAGGFRLEGVAVPAEAQFTEPGQAFRKAMAAIALARVVVAAMCVGALGRSLGIATEYLEGRAAFGAPLSDQQGLRWMMADVATDLAAAKALTRDAAAAIDRGEADAAVAVAHAKKFATRAASAGIERAMQMLGANGFRHDTALPRHFAGARMAHYIDGTTEVQNLVIARALFAGRTPPSPHG